MLFLGQGAVAKSIPGSCINPADKPDVMAGKPAGAVTDFAGKRRTDQGEPSRCTVFALHKLYTPAEELDDIAVGCRQAQVGCVESKAVLAEEISMSLEGFRRERRALVAGPSVVIDVLTDGAKRARSIAKATMDEVKEAMGLARI